MLMTTVFSVFFGLISHAQTTGATGKWETPDHDIIEFYTYGPLFTARQISTKTEKDKKNDNKIIGRELKPVSARQFEGIVIDPKDNKTYHGRFIINMQGTELQLKVNWGFVSFNEIWKRVD
ncbi:DUF2147 domain-containing protein [Curtobacterium sp. B8]|uniref:DUF2147 domain-containing protein n=1 Tax=Curtobacterium sp. B8 TaxID=95611 RepID=UPI001651083E|nr:DUF2147 domain-containing protein [Curtobacterium sp. B8]